MKNISKRDVSVVILAGGQALRMGNKDKGLILFNQKPLIHYVVHAVSQSVGSIWVSANRNLDLYQKFGQVVSDELSGYQGPLAGISAVLSHIDTRYLLVVPCDGPYINTTLLERLADEMLTKQAKLCVASEKGCLHPTFALLETSIKTELDQYLRSGQRKLGHFFKENNAIEVDFSDSPELFVNFNTPEDLLKR
ncbi:molybdenum cofactor guanylyltransferase [Candidatus Thioglobus autotrophicus]|uniref:Molybdenum cofactor guanylyltransferase n=1 Tax=Candidatus Thioglobus autotrophicus TaxID=1705394 RepID=A0A0M4NUE2_9GAMM|nr:molybdenum cofactor guanylyltransferase MobA [Candidatus Thioglobus autotrophicus]ALE52932.1 molybdenum cofactor guanylyltransferase [Candidatus Thioglobus autotrophicus]WPE16993.1 molybdenum cofactor guanylyltransferase MobA [Candidatus Thioglobus autotrophicus]WPE18548.1 molybdenum cofactor guanylyltransferase MobA [Candidatus Thioglobus autotrophicus]